MKKSLLNPILVICTALISSALVLSSCSQASGSQNVRSFFAGSQAAKADIPLYLDESADIEARIDDAMSRMTLEEKVAILHAQSKFSSAGVPRLGIPELWCSDGPHGIRAEVLWDEWNTANWTNDSCIAFPALTCLSASWNPEMSALYGKSIGEEARFREKDVLLGPGVNIFRTPLNGRNFEYMGEDPSLSAHMVVPYVQNVQKNGVAVCVKHFALNNEETYRHSTDVDLSDRALYEIYLPAFKAAVCEGGAWSIMSSYNLFRGRHVSQDTILTKRILKDEWGFDGAVISDWGAVHDTDEAIESGLDLEFGTWTNGLTMGKTNAYASYFLADPFLERLRDGRATEDQLNEKVRRVLRLMMRTAMRSDKPLGSLCSDEHYAAARRIAGEGIVLLKNECGDCMGGSCGAACGNHVLPIKSDVRKILVVGENAIKPLCIGGGSSSLKVQHEISPLQGIIERARRDGAEAGTGIDVSYARGYVGSPGTAQDGLATTSLSDSRSAGELIAEAVQMAANADVVLFFGGLNKDGHQDCEGTDRLALGLPYGQDTVIEALAAANPNLAVIIISGTAVEMPWIDAVPAIVLGWYLGSEAGHAFADVLFGDVNPSGKLPFTFPMKLEDSPAHHFDEALTQVDGNAAPADGAKIFPVNGKNFYEEGIYVGYRWYEARDIKPLFAFGHGLSYTTFAYGDATLDRTVITKSKSSDNGLGGNASGRKNSTFTVSVPVTNTGSIKGAEVVQVYVRDLECTVDRPKKELKGFSKIVLEPGETKVVSVTLNEDDLRYFDEQAHSWVSEAGDFDILIGSASDDIRTTARLTLK